MLREAKGISVSYKALWHTLNTLAAFTILLQIEGLRDNEIKTVLGDKTSSEPGGQKEAGI